MATSALKTATARIIDEPEVSPNVEMYLKSIVRLHDSMEPVSTSAIAQELAISAASASAMLKRLDADGYVTHEGRHGVVPTAKGARIGALTLRRQRLAERLLVDCLGIAWDLASSEACRLEHAISPLVESRLAQFVGDPTTCPHGHPIPREDGTLWRHDNAIDLVDLPLGVPAKVLEVKHEIPELLRFLAEVQLRPGASVTLRKLERAVGLLTIEVGGKRHTVSLQLAGDILVRDPSAKQRARR
ncbi:MAG: metal-dependent transcriptional regulator [Candidatus Eremiobacteraeota bacterium]|nr:metal-dependent transcriptional regulator [Candidatus Eremiobacteraeota bacterium]MBC5826186.1 metal-dependent transcriptional regulator [Candidatus Eremiobacteraeota bacterium]